MLSATEIGLGGCMIGSYDSKKVSTLLHIPEPLTPRLILALGKPDETVVLEDAKDGQLTYYRDDQNVHHVPKLGVEDMIL